MDIGKILNELRDERQNIEFAIISLQRLAAIHGGPRRGRPPAWLKNISTDRPAKRSETRNKPATAAAQA